MTQDQAIEEAKKIAASIPATEDNPRITVLIADGGYPSTPYWSVTFKQEEHSEMDDRGFWMDTIIWEFESITAPS